MPRLDSQPWLETRLTALRILLAAALLAWTAGFAQASPSADLNTVNALLAMPSGRQDAYCGEVLRMQGLGVMQQMKASQVDADSVNAAIGKFILSTMRTEQARAAKLSPQTLEQLQHRVSAAFGQVPKEARTYCGSTAFMDWHALPQARKHELNRKATAEFVADARALHLNVPASVLPEMTQAPPGTRHPGLQPTPAVVSTSASAPPSTLRFMPPSMQAAFCAGIFKKEAVERIQAMKAAGTADLASVTYAMVKYEYFTIEEQVAKREGFADSAPGAWEDEVARGMVPVGQGDDKTCLGKTSAEYDALNSNEQALALHKGIQLVLQNAQQVGLDIPLSVLPQSARGPAPSSSAAARDGASNAQAVSSAAVSSQPAPFAAAVAVSTKPVQSLAPMDQDAFCAGHFKKMGLDLILSMKKSGNVDKETAKNAAMAYGYYGLLTHESYDEGITNPRFYQWVNSVLDGQRPVSQDEANFCMSKGNNQWAASTQLEQDNIVQMDLRLFMQAARKHDLRIPFDVIPEEVQARALAH